MSIINVVYRSSSSKKWIKTTVDDHAFLYYAGYLFEKMMSKSVEVNSIDDVEFVDDYMSLPDYVKKHFSAHMDNTYYNKLTVIYRKFQADRIFIKEEDPEDKVMDKNVYV